MARIKSIDPKEVQREEERTMLGKQLLIASSRNELEKVKQLIEKGADVNYKNIHNETAVLAACEGAAMEVLQFLVTKGASLDVKTASDQHPIHFAAASGNEAIVKWLAGKGQNLSAQAFDGSSPLHVATRQGQVEVARWLLTNKSVSVNKADYSGLTPAHIAAVMPRRKPVLDVLITSGANLNKESFRGDTVLHLAARKAEQEVLIYLIERGAKIGCPQCGKDGKNCDTLDERAASFLRQEVGKWKQRQKGQKKDPKDKADKKEKKTRDKDDAPKAVLAPPPPVPANGERKSFDGMRPEYVIAAPEKKKGFLSSLMSRNPLSRNSSPGKTQPTSAPPSQGTTTLERRSFEGTRSISKERSTEKGKEDKAADTQPHVEVSPPPAERLAASS